MTIWQPHFFFSLAEKLDKLASSIGISKKEKKKKKPRMVPNNQVMYIAVLQFDMQN